MVFMVSRSLHSNQVRVVKQIVSLFPDMKDTDMSNEINVIEASLTTTLATFDLLHGFMFLKSLKLLCFIIDVLG